MAIPSQYEWITNINHIYLNGEDLLVDSPSIVKSSSHDPDYHINLPFSELTLTSPDYTSGNNHLVTGVVPTSDGLKIFCISPMTRIDVDTSVSPIVVTYTNTTNISFAHNDWESYVYSMNFKQYDGEYWWGWLYYHQAQFVQTYLQSSFSTLQSALEYIYQHYANIILYVDGEKWVDPTPITYTWQSVPSISGKNGILSLAQIASDSINDGEPVSDAAATAFSDLPAECNVGEIIDDLLPYEESLVDVLVKYKVKGAVTGAFEYVKLVTKKGSIPKSVEDGDKVVDINPSKKSKLVTGLDEGSKYYFVIFEKDSEGQTAQSSEKSIRTGDLPDGTIFEYTGEIQTFVAPKTGIYLLEAWGAQGGNATDGTLTARGGYGAYAVGEVLLQQGDTLYINVGGQNGYGGGGNYQSPNQYRYVKLVIKDNRGHTSVTQLSRIMLHDVSLQQTVDFSNATATSTPEGNTDEKANKLIDYDTNTKLCISNYTPSSNNPITIIIDIGADIDFDIYNTWEWWTANDHNERDPITFDLYLSKNGTDYVLVDSAENTNPTTERYALGYTKTLTL